MILSWELVASLCLIVMYHLIVDAFSFVVCRIAYIRMWSLPPLLKKISYSLNFYRYTTFFNLSLFLIPSLEWVGPHLASRDIGIVTSRRKANAARARQAILLKSVTLCCKCNVCKSWVVLTINIEGKRCRKKKTAMFWPSRVVFLLEQSSSVGLRGGKVGRFGQARFRSLNSEFRVSDLMFEQSSVSCHPNFCQVSDCPVSELFRIWAAPTRLSETTKVGQICRLSLPNQF